MSRLEALRTTAAAQPMRRPGWPPVDQLPSPLVAPAVYPDMATEPIYSRGTGRSAPKRKTGCMTCRRRKVRCDEAKPVCRNCVRLRLDCTWLPDRKLGSPSDSTSDKAPMEVGADPHPLHLVPSAPPSLPSTTPSWLPTDTLHGWRVEDDLDNSFASPFQDVFLSSINSFDGAVDLSYGNDWNHDPAYPPPGPVPEPDAPARPPESDDPADGREWREVAEEDPVRTNALIEHFVQSANPVSVILPTDTEWRSASRSLRAMAGQCQCVRSAICALSALHLFTTKQGDTLQEAVWYYERSSKLVDELFDSPNINGPALKNAFATLFLLTRVELMAQTSSEAKADGWPLHHLQSAAHRVHQHGDQIKQWTGISKRLLTWNTLLQTKAEYNAGISTLTNSSEILSNSIGDPFARLNRTGKISSLSDPSRPRRGSDPDQDPSDSDESEEDTRTIPELVYDTMNQPAFDFYLKSQSFTSRIVSLDRYHRRRGTVDAEFETLKHGQRISADLHALWAARPATLAFLDNAAALHHILRPWLASKLLLNLRVYTANFYAQFIYLHRVAYKAYPATADVEIAVKRVVDLAKGITSESGREPGRDNGSLATTTAAATARSRGEEGKGVRANPATADAVGAGATEAYDWRDGDRNNTPPPADVGLPASMIWPLFLAAIEGSLEDRAWLLDAMRGMNPTAVPDAQLTASLLEEVLRRQDREERRIDHRSVRKDLFDGELSVLY